MEWMKSEIGTICSATEVDMEKLCRSCGRPRMSQEGIKGSRGFTSDGFFDGDKSAG